MLNIESFFFFFFFPPTIESRLLETIHVETIWPVFLYKMNRTTCHWSNARRPTQHTCIAAKYIRTKNALELNPKSAKSFELPLTTSYDRLPFPIYFPFSPDKGIFPRLLIFQSQSVNRFLRFHLQQSLSILCFLPSPRKLSL